MKRDWAHAMNLPPAAYLIIPVAKLGAGLIALFGAGVVVGSRRKVSTP